MYPSQISQMTNVVLFVEFGFCPGFMPGATPAGIFVVAATEAGLKAPCAADDDDDEEPD